MFTATKLSDPVDEVVSKTASDVVVEERRTTARLTQRLEIELTGMGYSEGYRCVAEDVSETGILLHSPAEYGLAVGQRCEIRFADCGGSPKLSALKNETCFATVVRTTHQPSVEGSTIEAGLRFDHPLFF